MTLHRNSFRLVGLAYRLPHKSRLPSESISSVLPSPFLPLTFIMSSTPSDSEKNYLPQESAVVIQDVDQETYEYTPEQVEAYVIDPAIARSVTRKMDIRILPLCLCMYFFSALDRGNLG